MTSIPHSEPFADRPATSLSTASYQGYRILQCGFVAVPIIAGIDKFFYALADWSKYLAPFAARTLGDNTRNFMMAVGIIEIVAGLGVAVKPKIFAFVVCAWLIAIMANLLSTGMYFDVALRDLGLAVAAFVLGRLAMFFDQGSMGGLMHRNV